MQVHEKTNNGIDVKTNVLILMADSFEEERILAAIKNCIKKGGSMEICVPHDNDTDKVLNCSFNAKESPEEG